MRTVAMLLAVLAVAATVMATIIRPSHAREGDNNACDRGSQSVLCKVQQGPGGR